MLHAGPSAARLAVSVFISLTGYKIRRNGMRRRFPKIDAAFHHGGAGTTGASLRAGALDITAAIVLYIDGAV